MDTQGLKVLPGGQLFLFGKLLWQTGYKEQRIRLLDHLIALEPVEADLVIAGLVAGFELRRLNALQQVERIVLAVVTSMSGRGGSWARAAPSPSSPSSPCPRTTRPTPSPI